MQQCIQQQQAKLQRSPGSNICSILGPILQCMDPLTECFTTEELNRFKGAEAGTEFENCQQYKDLAGEGSVAGINMGILIALFIVVAYFGI